jgi:hypothetical protein
MPPMSKCYNFTIAIDFDIMYIVKLERRRSVSKHGKTKQESVYVMSMMTIQQ